MNDTTMVLRRRPGPRSWLLLGAAAAAVLALLLLIAVACDPAGQEDGGDSLPPPPTPTADASADAAGSDGLGNSAGDGGEGQDGEGQDGGGQDGGGPSTAPAPPGPEFEYFRVAQQPRCPAGTDKFPIEGSPVVLEWKVNGTDQVTLSIDNAGAFADYPAEGGETRDFPCEGQEGDIQRHTYLLTATNADGTTTRELVVEAEVHERPEV